MADDPKSKCILIVDDDEAILNLLEILVKRDGFEVLRAESGEAALYKLKRKPHVVLLDLIMPGATSGIEVLRHLRECEEDVPIVVVITGHDSNHPTVQEAKKDPNVAQFFQKPINQDKLLALLHKLLKTKIPEGSPALKAAEREKGP